MVRNERVLMLIQFRKLWTPQSDTGNPQEWGEHAAERTVTGEFNQSLMNQTLQLTETGQIST